MEKKPLQNERIKKCLARISALSDMVPGVIIIHSIPELKVEYMSPQGLRDLGISLEELQNLGPEYHERFFNPEDSKVYVPRILALIEGRTSDESISFFQQVRTGTGGCWRWHFSSLKILMRDELNKPLLTITTSFPVDPLTHVTSKVARILNENSFLRQHFHKFSKLGKREREVLRLMAMGQPSCEIASQLFIAHSTVETHRKNIRQKLRITSHYDISQYAQAFDLL